MNQQSKLVKKYWCGCHQCRHSDYNRRIKKRFTRGSNSYKDTMHKLRVRRIRRQKHNQWELRLYSVGYTD